jgi:O-antigen/teichoic acid export membrane protein
VVYFRSAEEVGLYQAASQSAILFGIILGAFGTIFMPMIVDLYHRKELERLDELFKVSTKWGLYLSLPLFLVLWFAPAEVLAGIFGAGFEAGAPTLKILAVAQLINVSTGTVGPMLIMTGHQKQWLAISASMLVLNLALSTLLIPRFGISGAAVASGCALTGLFVLGLAAIKRLLGVWPYDWRYLKGAAAAGVAYLALRAISQMSLFSVFFDGLLLRILSLSIIASLIFVTALFLLGLSDEDRTVLSLMLNKIKALVMFRR